MQSALFSSQNDNWETPEAFFCEIDSEFHFTLDPCCSEANAKCKKHFTIHEDGLLHDWEGETVFCNPPYSRRKQDAWVRKCCEEGMKKNTTVVALLPARTDTARFHDFVLGKAEIRFIRGRLKFVGAKDPAPFPSMLVIWRGEKPEGWA